MIPVKILQSLQERPEQIRNVCVIAHVDHGKTTLTDCLVASNGIIGSRSAGKMRFMDYTAEEQARGITMKSSSVSLLYKREAGPGAGSDVGLSGVDGAKRAAAGTAYSTRKTPDATAVVGSSSALGGPHFLVNLVDSPGHVDFVGEVIAAMHTLDGAVVVVDVVEGVCIQTQTVLRQAVRAGLVPCLVLNKLDRLVGELQMSCEEAYDHLLKVLQQVNACMAALTAELTAESVDNLEEDKSSAPVVEADDDGADAVDVDGYEEPGDDYFVPGKNVVFASAIDRWAFRLDDFANLYAKKLGMSAAVLRKTLWGEFYLLAKQKKIVRRPPANATNPVPLFVKFVLRTIWDVYATVLDGQDTDRALRMAATLGAKLTARDLAAGRDRRDALRTVMSGWLPISRALFEVVVSEIPSPAKAQAARVRRHLLLDSRHVEGVPGADAVARAVGACQATGPPVAFFSKVLAVPSTAFPRATGASGSDSVYSAHTNFVAFGRLFSGTLRVGAKILALGPRYDPTRERRRLRRRRRLLRSQQHRVEQGVADYSATLDSLAQDRPLDSDADDDDGVISEDSDIDDDDDDDDNDGSGQGHVCDDDEQQRNGDSVSGPVADKHCVEIEVGPLFIFMGPEVHPVSSVPAGNVFGMLLEPGSAAEQAILKTATLVDRVPAPQFALRRANRRDRRLAKPILRVAVEPEYHGDLARLTVGLRQLNRADPAVRVRVQGSGELVLVCAGELHLQRCLDDLKKRFAPGVALHVSPPLVPFRETVIVTATDAAAAAAAKATAAASADAAALALTVGGEDDDGCTTPAVSLAGGQPLHASSNDGGGRGGGDHVLGSSATEAFGQQQQPQLVDSANDGRPIDVWTADKQMRMRVRALAIPEPVARTLEDRFHQLVHHHHQQQQQPKTMDGNTTPLSAVEQLRAAFQEAGPLWVPWADRVCAIGPRASGTNMLLASESVLRAVSWPRLVCGESRSDDGAASTVQAQSIVGGFRLACAAGPLCEEPVRGVCFIVDQMTAEGSASPDLLRTADSGQLTSITRAGFRRAFLAAGPRLVEAISRCEVQVAADFLGKAYSVLGRRRAKVVKEEMKEGTPVFAVHALVPLRSSFGLSAELNQATSGAASAQLQLEGWSVLDDDPFYVPVGEELEEHGYNLAGIGNNLAKDYVKEVRQRKGLQTDEQLVVHAEKQRTISRKK